jgi:hypothetical protein
MRLLLTASVLALGAMTLGAPAAPAAAEARVLLAQASEPELVQSRRRARAPRVTAPPRARILVTPRYPYRPFHSLYPLPYPIEYPGPNAVRQCTAHYVMERRLSGDVVVPRMNCWWVAR